MSLGFEPKVDQKHQSDRPTPVHPPQKLGILSFGADL